MGLLGFWRLPGHDFPDIPIQQFVQRMLGFLVGEMSPLNNPTFNHCGVFAGLGERRKYGALGWFAFPSDTNMVGNCPIFRFVRINTRHRSCPFALRIL
jgi:hypothetical protein